MSLTRVLPAAALLVSMSPCAPALAQQQPQPQQPPQAQTQQQSPQSLWVNFNHYVLVARPDLAQSYGQALLDQADPQTLLAAVESGEYPDWQANLQRARQIEGLEQIADQLEQQIQAARIAVSREASRIQQDIELLQEGGRPYRNAVQRLRGAGQYAAPYLLEVLRDNEQPQLHPYVMRALVDIGLPVAAPLSRALPHLNPVTQAQVAQVLAEIGYPLPALPYLKEVAENEGTSSAARAAVERAFQILMSRSDIPADLGAADLYLLLGQTRYTQGTRGQTLPGHDAGSGEGIVWEFAPEAGLVAVPVPGVIYDEVLAMDAASRALSLDSNLDQALSLYLMANLRRENQLPQGVQDPSYPTEAQPASFYAMLAGPERLHDVLAQAIRDSDAPLALDAIDALSKTAGTASLVSQGTARQPLLRALSFPDQMVRFHAAQALANARPQQEFPGYFRVVPVLAEAIRPADARYALVLAGSQERLNELLASVGEQGFEAVGGLSLDDAQDDLRTIPAVDLMVVDLSAGDIAGVLQQTQQDYTLGAVPVIARVSPERQLSIREAIGDLGRLIVSGDNNDAESLAAAIEQALGDTGGPLGGDDLGTQYALRALQILRDIAIDQSVYNVADAENTLVSALQDARPEIVSAAGQVLALLNSSQAQQALADAALSNQGDLQIDLLQSLGSSATQYGNHVSDQQLSRLLSLVQSAQGETAIAAARAHGALTPPTANAVEMIAGQSR